MKTTTPLKIRLILLTIMSVLAAPPFTNLHAQSGQEHPKTKWMTIETETFDIIYPEEYQEKAEKYARLLETLAPNIGNTTGTNPERISIILNNSLNIGNGYVSPLPRHSRLYHIPALAPEMHFTDWEELLAIHELRHVAQFDAANQDMIRLYSILLGDLGHAAATFFAFPAWFFEGDAVFIETAFSDFGRGRSPTFWMTTRAQLISNIKSEYASHLMGSDRVLHPNHYEMGFLILSYLREVYGHQAIRFLIEETAKRPFNPYGFAKSVKIITGQNLTVTYEEMKRYYYNQWSGEHQLHAKTGFTKTNTHSQANNKLYTSYRHPQPLADGSILALKSGKYQNRHVVKIKGGHETYMFPVSYTTATISANQDFVVWSEWNIDSRWQAGKSQLRAYSFDLKQGNKIKYEGNLFEGQIDAASNYLSAIEYLPNGSCRLVTMNLGNSRSKIETTNTRALNCPPDTIWSAPYPYANGEKVALVQFTPAGKELIIVDMKSGKARTIMHAGPATLDSPFYADGKIYFRSGVNGVDNLYAIPESAKTNHAAQITNVPFGAFDPYVKNGTAYFANYNPSGYFIESAKAENIKNVEFTNKGVSPIKENTYKAAELRLVEMDQVDPGATPKKYRRTANSLNLHSWDITSPLFSSFIGASAVSTNVLNTLQVSGSYYYYPEYDSHNGSLGAVFLKYWPILGIRADVIDERTYFYNAGSDSTTEYEIQAKLLSPYMTIPIRFSNGNLFQMLSLNLGGIFTQYQQIEVSEGAQPPTSENMEAYGYSATLNYVFLRDGAPTIQKGFPTVQADLSLNYQHGVISGDEYFNKMAATAGLWWSGIGYGHTMGVHGSYMEKDLVYLPSISENQYLTIAMSLENINYLQEYGVSYSLPLLYQDANLFGLIYLKTGYISLFYQNTLGVYDEYSASYEMVGVTYRQKFSIFSKVQFFNALLTYAYNLEDGEVYIYYGFDIQF